MRALRIASVTGLLALVAGATSVSATPRQSVCNLIKDKTNDTSSLAPDPSLEAQLDILSADIATDGKNMTAVVRLRALTAEDVTQPAGRTYEFDFSVGGETHFLFLGSLLTGGDHFGLYKSDTRWTEGEGGARAATGIAPARGSVDVAKKEIRFTVPLSVFAPHATIKHRTLDHLVAFTFKAHGAATNGLAGEIDLPVEASGSGGIGVDEAWGRKAQYSAGARSCVHVGQ